jgi:ATP-dependent DNA ligase
MNNMINFFYPPKPKRIWPNSSYFQRLSKNPLWDGEVKYNGWRLLMIKNETPKLFSCHSNTIDIKSSIFEDSLQKVPKFTCLDGELIEFRTKTLKNIIIFWDCMFFKGKDLRLLPLSERRKYLDFETAPIILTQKNQPQIFKTRQYKTDLVDLYNSIVARNDPIEEGIVIKNTASVYTWHQFRKGIEIDDWIKVKKIGEHAEV